MTKQIFDQDRPRSTMAQGLDEAFAGCEEWTVVTAPSRRSTLDVAPWVAPDVLRTRATEDAARRRVAAA